VSYSAKSVADFFEKYGRETVAVHDLGYDCSLEVSVDDLYDMFKARLRLEQGGYTLEQRVLEEEK